LEAKTDQSEERKISLMSEITATENILASLLSIENEKEVQIEFFLGYLVTLKTEITRRKTKTEWNKWASNWKTYNTSNLRISYQPKSHDIELLKVWEGDQDYWINQVSTLKSKLEAVNEVMQREFSFLQDDLLHYKSKYRKSKKRNSHLKKNNSLLQLQQQTSNATPSAIITHTQSSSALLLTGTPSPQVSEELKSPPMSPRRRERNDNDVDDFRFVIERILSDFYEGDSLKILHSFKKNLLEALQRVETLLHLLKEMLFQCADHNKASTLSRHIKSITKVLSYFLFILISVF
jgi:hypothetical protein